MNASALEISHVSHSFSGIKASDDISFKVLEGSIAGVIGPNGAGKSTLFNIITGRYTPDAGSVTFCGAGVTGKKSSDLAVMGLVRTFQNNRLFKEMSVIDHLKCAMQRRFSYSFWDTLFRTAKFRAAEQAITEECLKLLREFGMEEFAFARAGGLPYGKQKLLEILRALSLKPKVLLLDEPAAGLNETESRQLGTLIQMLRDKYRVTVVLIEHDMRLVMKVCEKIAVLVNGRLIAEGTPAEIRSDTRVISAYLGGGNAT